MPAVTALDALCVPLDRIERQSQHTHDALADVAPSFHEAAQRVQSVCDKAWAETCTRRNCDVPIMKLPPEIICAIIESCAGPRHRSLPSNNDHHYHRRTARSYGWLRVTLVCRHWREVALRQPIFWNILTVRPPRGGSDQELELTTQWLLRGGSTPLFVYIKHLDETTVDIVDQLSSRCDQFRSFYVDSMDTVEHIRPFDAPAPLLDRLGLRAPEGKAIDLSQLFANQMPSLRRLRIYNTARFEGTTFRDLTHIFLYWQIYSTHDFRVFLSVLRSNLNLEELALQWCDPTDSTATFATSHLDPIPLSRLSTLLLHECPPAMVGGLLACLTLRDGQHVNFRLAVEKPALLPHLPVMFPSPLQSRIAPLQTSMTALELRLDRFEYGGLYVHVTGPSSAVLISCSDVSEDDMDDVGPQLVHDLEHIFPFAQLDTLFISGLAIFALPSWAEWRELLGRLPCVATLVVDLAMLDDDEEWLQALTDINLDGRPYPVPALRTLRLMPPITDESYPLTVVVENRCQSGHKLETLQLLQKMPTTAIGFEEDFDNPETIQRWIAQKAVMEQFVDKVDVVKIMSVPSLQPKFPFEYA